MHIWDLKQLRWLLIPCRKKSVRQNFSTRRLKENRKSSCSATKPTTWKKDAWCQWPHTLQSIWIFGSFRLVWVLVKVGGFWCDFFPFSPLSLPAPSVCIYLYSYFFLLLLPKHPIPPLTSAPLWLFEFTDSCPDSCAEKSWGKCSLVPRLYYMPTGRSLEDILISLWCCPVEAPSSQPLNVTTNLKAYSSLKQESLYFCLMAPTWGNCWSCLPFTTGRAYGKHERQLLLICKKGIGINFQWPQPRKCCWQQFMLQRNWNTFQNTFLAF